MHNTFEKIIIFKKIPYSLYWAIIGIVGFVASESLFFYFGEKHYLISMIIASFTLAFVPTYNIWISHEFKKLVFEISPSLWENEKGKDYIFSIDFSEIFTLKLPIAKLVTCLIMIPGILTIIYLGIPFNTLTMKIIGVMAFLLVLWFCGQTLYISFALLFALSKIVNRPVKVPFMLIPNPAIAKLQSFYSITSLSIAFLYILLTVAIWQGPYGLHPLLLVWLTLLAFYPGSMLVWSFFQIHNLLQKIKYSYIRVINDQIQRALHNVKKGETIKDIERLDKLLKIQSDVQRVNEYPLALNSGITFTITLITAIAQILVSIKQIFP